MQNSETVFSENWQNPTLFEVPVTRLWFVENGGYYVGPVPASEVERLWRAGEADEHTRVWTEGMPTWQPLGDVPDLMYLASEIVATPVLPTWRTTEAASLASLVESELQAVAVIKTAAPRRVAPSDLPAIEVVGGVDPFARWWADTGLHTQMSPLPIEPWASRVRRSRTSLWKSLLAVSSVAVIAVAAISIYGSISGRFDLMSMTRTVLLGAPAVPVLVATPVPVTPVAVAPMPVAPASDAAPTPAASKPEAKEVAKPTAASASAAKAEVVPKSAVTTSAERQQPAKPVVKARPKAVVADDAASANAAALTPPEVVAATRGQVKGLVPCIKQARATGQLESARYVFVLDWTIRADGGVSTAALKAPGQFVGSELGSCFAAAMRKWRYRASSDDFNVANFPMPVTVP